MWNRRKLKRNNIHNVMEIMMEQKSERKRKSKTEFYDRVVGNKESTFVPQKMSPTSRSSSKSFRPLNEGKKSYRNGSSDFWNELDKIIQELED
tara:strand:+ start:143 stop:421 length:279 start_codon:yes stop_codon:yes gene_type:complete